MNKLHVMFRRDMSIKKDFLDISVSENPVSLRPIAEAEMVAFIDTDGSTRILKNRWGIRGAVVSDSDYLDFLRLTELEKNNKKTFSLKEFFKKIISKF